MILLVWAQLTLAAVLASIYIALRLTRGAEVTAIAVSIVVVGGTSLVTAIVADPPAETVRVAVAASAVAASALGGWPVSATVLRWALSSTSWQTDVLPATGWIGVAERFGFSLALVMGLPEVAALVVGVKALGVYAAPTASVTNVTASARVLGTLVSIGWALSVYASYRVATH